MNVNFLGEAILGEEEARHRLQIEPAGSQLADIEVISVKISTLYSQFRLSPATAPMATLCDRLEMLYRTAVAA